MTQPLVTANSASVDYYNRNAVALASRYESAHFADIHGHLLPFLPERGSNILDVGAGSGRDAAALAALGYAVVAAEPAVKLVEQSRIHHSGADIEWVVDALPALALIKALPRRFEFILCSAVLMHVEPNELDASFDSFAVLLRAKGHLALSLRRANDSDDRSLFQDYETPVIVETAAKAGFALVSKRASTDRFGRPEISWQSLIFRR